MAPGRGVAIDALSKGAHPYPWHLARERVLRDGRPVLVRPVHPEDLPHAASFLTHLSPQARRARFQRLSAPQLKDLAGFYTRVDYADHMAFIAAAREGGRELIVGDARYFANPDGRSCEFGIVVADDYRHTGLAQHLMNALTTYARERGLRTMASLVLRENNDMLDFAREQGFDIERQPLDPQRVRITKSL